MVAAAFVGPGTITTCTLAGANFGYSLLWALIFATAATIILQEMSARLGAVTQQGLGETLRQVLDGSFWKWPLYLLIMIAICLGNAAYEAGNVSGAALGISAIVGDDNSYRVSVFCMALLAAAILWFGSYRQVEKMLLALVLLMAIAFVATFVMVQPKFSQLLSGLVIQIPGGALTTVVALIGTTVVPYNLFLHASAVKSRWPTAAGLGDARADTLFSIGFGGLITVLVVSTAAASLFGSGIQVTGVKEMALQFEPLFGATSKYLLGVGLCAAGLSSAITAPLATAFAMSEILGFEKQEASRRFRWISLSIIFVGAALAVTGIKPITIILSAQFANGMLLPIVAGFLLLAMNRRELLGAHTNSWLSNVLGGAVMVVTAGLGLRSIAAALGFI
ncbi:MAG: Nramp family divalent metal transporter [Cellvibrionaceae bacterium]|nr:Nramp family divalent metal transporter [Cellvibrionaceae bacterium]